MVSLSCIGFMLLSGQYFAKAGQTGGLTDRRTTYSIT